MSPFYSPFPYEPGNHFPLSFVHSFRKTTIADMARVPLQAGYISCHKPTVSKYKAVAWYHPFFFTTRLLMEGVLLP